MDQRVSFKYIILCKYLKYLPLKAQTNLLNHHVLETVSGVGGRDIADIRRIKHHVLLIYNRNCKPGRKGIETMLPNPIKIQDQLDLLLLDAESKGKPYIDISCGEVYRLLGGKPGPSLGMGMCCSIMKKQMKKGDKVMQGFFSRQSDSWTIRYILPR